LVGSCSWPRDARPGSGRGGAVLGRAGAASDPVVDGGGGHRRLPPPFDESTAALINKVPAATVRFWGRRLPHVRNLAPYNRCFTGPSWGQFTARTHPTPGTMTTQSAERQSATGLLSTTCIGRRRSDQGSPAYDLGAWHSSRGTAPVGVPAPLHPGFRPGAMAAVRPGRPPRVHPWPTGTPSGFNYLLAKVNQHRAVVGTSACRPSGTPPGHGGRRRRKRPRPISTSGFPHQTRHRPTSIPTACGSFIVGPVRLTPTGSTPPPWTRTRSPPRQRLRVLELNPAPAATTGPSKATDGSILDSGSDTCFTVRVAA